MQRVVASTTIKVKPKDGTNGKDAQPPYVGENGNWFIWSSSQNKYVDSGNPAIGIDGKSPEIRDGYWWLWDGTEWYNSGIKAKGEDSKSLEITGNTTLHNPTKVGGVKTTTLTATRRNVESVATLAWQYNIGGNWQNTPWYTDSITIDYDTHSTLFQNGVLYLKCYVLGDPTIFKTISINVTNDGEDGRGVTSIVEQYYLSNSSTTQTGGSWVNHIPTWVSGKHIWSSSLITFTDSSTERVAVTLVPSLSGTSIVSVDVEYAKNQSRTTKPTTGWSTEAPTAQKGWFIWSRTKIVYSNSPTPSYTNVVCISGSDGNDGDNGSDGLSVYLGFNSYSYRVDANGFAIAKTLSIPIYAYQNKTRLNISASQISVSGFVPYGMNISKSTNTVTISVTSSFQPIPGGEGIVVYVEIDGATYLLNYNWSITQDGKSPYIGSNGNWYVWNGTSFVDSGDSATGDDGKSPEIRSGYWWAWDGTKWYNTGVKAKGEDGSDGERGLPGAIVVKKKWVEGDTHIRNDAIVHALYVDRGTKSASDWYRLADNRTISMAGAPPAANVVPQYYERITSMMTMQVDVLLANEAYVAGFVMKDEMFWSTRGTLYNGQEVNYGDYYECHFCLAGTATPSDGENWTLIPPSSYPAPYMPWVRIRFIRNGQIVSSSKLRYDGPMPWDASVGFALTANATQWPSTPMAGAKWIRIGTPGNVFSRATTFKMNIQDNEIDFEPYTIIDGRTGMIYARNAKIRGSLSVIHNDGGETRIDGSGLQIFNAEGFRNIQYGLENGYTVMKYFDNDGTLLYDLGPGGLKYSNVREEKWVQLQLVYLGSTMAYVLTNSTAKNIYKNPSQQVATTYYRYVSKINAGVNLDPENDGKIFVSQSKSSSKLPNGVYMRPTDGEYEQFWSHETGNVINPPEMHPSNEQVIDRAPIYLVTMQTYSGGSLISQQPALWNGINDGTIPYIL